MSTTEQDIAVREEAVAPRAHEPDGPVTIITAERRITRTLSELWQYRELLYFLVWRDIKVRYKQTAIGASWAVIQPVITIGIFSVIFGRFARMPSEGIPYPVFAYAGLLPWQLFAGSLQRAVTSIVGNTNLITRVYFPRLAIPMAATFSQTVDFAIAFGVLIVLAVRYGIVPSWHIVALPGFIALVLLTALGVSFWFSALNVVYRDVGHAVPFIVQVWLYASPVVYPATLIPERLQWVYALNPMVGVIEGFRWALLDKPAPALGLLAVSSVLAITVFVSGVLFFRRMERVFADVI